MANDAKNEGAADKKANKEKQIELRRNCYRLYFVR